MSFTGCLRILLVFILFLSITLVFVGCAQNNTTININSQRPNYNNIYGFAHSNFWVDKQTVYYSKSGFYNNTYYQLDNNGRQVITTDNAFKTNVANNSDGEIIGGIQAYENNVFFWYANETGQRELYRYDNTDKSFEKLISVSEKVNDWAIVNDIVVYSTFCDEDDIDINSLWFCDFKSGTPQKIANKTSAFGICGNKVRYVENAYAGESVLYEFDLEIRESVLLSSFNGSNDGYNPYNFTEKHIVFISDRLHIVEVKTGEQIEFDLPGQVKFFNCYKDYIFVCSDTDIYRINVSTGEFELLCKMRNECNLLYAISDECVIGIFYDSSSITINVEVYAVYANGNSEKLFNI